jgi:hypothetical protein
MAVQAPVAAAVLRDGQPARLADDDVEPLHHHDRDEVGRVARALEDLPVVVGPLLEVGVLEISLWIGFGSNLCMYRNKLVYGQI